MIQLMMTDKIKNLIATPTNALKFNVPYYTVPGLYITVQILYSTVHIYIKYRPVQMSLKIKKIIVRLCIL